MHVRVGVGGFVFHTMDSGVCSVPGRSVKVRCSFSFSQLMRNALIHRLARRGYATDNDNDCRQRLVLTNEVCYT